MPELPEVEIMTRNVRGWVQGATLLAVEVRDPKLGDAGDLVVGQRLERVRRRAKYLLMEFSSHVLAWHFRMTGSFVRAVDARPARAVLAFDNGVMLRFLDPRRFGTVEAFGGDELEQWESRRRLGPEPWPERRDGAWWMACVANARGPIKCALMEPDRVSGIGNIAASEILWRARVDPMRAPRTLSPAEWELLADSAHAFLSETIARDAGDEIAYVNAGGPNQFDVYGKDGEPCPRCGRPIERSVMKSRSTFCCRACQSGEAP